MVKKPEAGSEIHILEVVKGTMDFCILGTSPFICNRMSQKVWFELLAPKGKKSAVEKASSMKHDPIREFRDSPYIMKDEKAPTLIGILPTMFKGAMGTAALRMPGVKKTELEQLVSVNWDMQPMYGVPRVFMAITRSADMNKTPDVRTRALIPEWACKLSVTFIKPQLREQAIANLLAAAGFISGVGDWRQEKGSGSYGSFKIVSDDDADFVRIVKTQGRAAQKAAFDNPVAYNDETDEMLRWFAQEVTTRGFKKDENGEVGKVPSGVLNGKRPAKRNGEVRT